MRFILTAPPCLHRADVSHCANKFEWFHIHTGDETEGANASVMTHSHRLSERHKHLFFCVHLHSHCRNSSSASEPRDTGTDCYLHPHVVRSGGGGYTRLDELDHLVLWSLVSLVFMSSVTCFSFSSESERQRVTAVRTPAALFSTRAHFPQQHVTSAADCMMHQSHSVTECVDKCRLIQLMYDMVTSVEEDQSFTSTLSSPQIPEIKTRQSL